ncbi:MAG: hypothetical protein RIR49_535 [Actinomycetota bacterium]
MAASTTKAYIEIEKDGKIECMFNPTDLSFTVGAKWAPPTESGKQVPELGFQSGESASMDLELFFDTTNTGKSVTVTTNKLIALTRVSTKVSGYDKAKNNGRPPWVVFHWGKFRSFKAVVESVSVNYTYFAKSGDPLRARVKLSLKQFADDKKFPSQNPTSGTPAPQRSHMVQPGETLDRIAWQHYGDATKWRAIASANRIRDPFSLRAGVMLDIPTVDT